MIYSPNLNLSVNRYPETFREDTCVQFVIATLVALSTCSQNLAASKTNLLAGISGSTISAVGSAVSSAVSSSSVAQESNNKIGLLSLHCGHNCWPPQDDLFAFANFIKTCGFDINK